MVYIVTRERRDYSPILRRTQALSQRGVLLRARVVRRGLAARTDARGFALGRIAGWAAHILEQLADNRIIPPTVRYIGPAPRPYVPLEQRP
jgi:hypothetical protein